METDDCEESWLTFPVAGMNFRYEFNFSSNFHENPVKEIPFSLLPFIPSLLFDNQCSVNADACNVASRGEINSWKILISKGIIFTRNFSLNGKDNGRNVRTIIIFFRIQRPA